MTERRLLTVDNVGKAYPPGMASAGRLRAFWDILLHGRSDTGKRVLHDISFEVLQGESVGIIGANGAGKSTLLKLITGVLRPSAGSIRSEGNIAALLELGAGFEPEYTGMENLRMNAAFLGLSRNQVDERLDSILAFADIGEAIHEPIKHYSSGMVVRLGFAVVASVRPELLITDEVLAVGDESFQKKCIRWIESYLKDGGTMLMVSHNMYQVQKLCGKALWLESGCSRAWGDVFDVTQRYLEWHERNDAKKEPQSRLRGEGSLYLVEQIQINDDDPAAQAILEMNDAMEVKVRIHSPDGRPPVVLVGLVRANGTPIFGTATDHAGVEPEQLDDGGYGIAIHYERLSLLPGGYAVRVSAMDPEGLRVHDTTELAFTIKGRSRALGMAVIEHRWVLPSE
ncbi:MAG: ABC transporter ATP-binding protein [Pseudomonadota bacterium]